MRKIPESQEIGIWLVRHAPVRVSYIYGQTDLDADLSNDTAFKWLAGQLPTNYTAISSDLARCRQTLERTREFGGNVELTKLSAQLREQSFGAWEGLTYDQARERDPDGYLKFWENPIQNAPPLGESFSQVCLRVGEYFNSIAVETRSKDVVFFVHAGTIRAILAQALQLEPAQSQLFDITPLSLTRLTLYRHESVLSWKINWINKTDS